MKTNSSHSPPPVAGKVSAPTLELRALMQEAAALQACGPGEGGLKAFGQWLLGRYARAATDAAEEGLSLKVLGCLTRDVGLLVRWSQNERRLDHDASRVLLKERSLTLEEKKTEEAMQKRFEQWLERPEVRERVNRGRPLSEEERAQRVREILGDE